MRGRVSPPPVDLPELEDVGADVVEGTRVSAVAGLVASGCVTVRFTGFGVDVGEVTVTVSVLVTTAAPLASG